MIIAVNFPIYAIGKKKPEKNQGFNGIRTPDLRDTGAMLYQLSYEATHWERGQLIEFISSREEWNGVKYIWNNSYLNCCSRWKWRMIIAVNFPIYAIGKKKPEKNQGFKAIRTRDLRDTGAMLYQLSYEATHWERGQLIEFISSRELN